MIFVDTNDVIENLKKLQFTLDDSTLSQHSFAGIFAADLLVEEVDDRDVQVAII